jgi:hypothetical protein
MSSINFPGNVNVGGKLTCDSFEAPDNSIDAGGLSATLRLGQIQLPIADWRELSAAATINAAGNGGLLASDTTPIFERVNAGTDPQLRLRWAATNVDAITFSVASPPDLDNAQTVAVKIRAKMAAATDTPVIGVDVREDVGGSNIGGNSGALSDTLATVSKTFTATADTSTLKAWTITLTPAAHGTDALELYSVWLEYTRK